MRSLALSALFLAAGIVLAQDLINIYNRDNGYAFVLKEVHAATVVRGPLAKTTTTYLLDNPYTKLTEASFNFSLPEGAVLGGFGYWYKDEFVPGILMDKELAWFIYTAITSRDRDPGIMEMTSSRTFHAQIYPLAVGYPLRIQLTSISYLDPEYDRFNVPPPSWFGGHTGVEKEWKVDGGGKPVIVSDWSATVATDRVPANLQNDIYTSIVAERWKDGNVYVAGIAMGSLGQGLPRVSGLKRGHVTQFREGVSDDPAVYFSGIATGPTITVQQGGNSRVVSIGRVSAGNDVVKVWAQAELVDGYRGDLLEFSLKHQVPSYATALLAVPNSEKRLFEQKRKEYLARLRKERARMEREAQLARRRGGVPQVNWQSSRGGDPQILLEAKDAEKVFAVLPDGRVLSLRQLSTGWWTVNFEIPADAPEGTYKVRLVVVRKDGSRREEDIEYTVDRTAPTGVAFRQGGVVTVESEPGLAVVEAYTVAGRRIVLQEVQPGKYQATTTLTEAVAFVLAKDNASNMARLSCSQR